jgi:hypothetical protein
MNSLQSLMESVTSFPDSLEICENVNMFPWLVDRDENEYFERNWNEV